MTDSEVQVIKEKLLMSLKVPLVFEKTYHKFGVTQPNIQKLRSGQILVELPGAKDVDRIKENYYKVPLNRVLGNIKLMRWVAFNSC
jgi:SecD/SecF fusion protein